MASEPPQPPPAGPGASPVVPPAADAAAAAASDDDDNAYYGTPAWLHNFAVAATILAPVGMLLPPRRLDFRNAVLASGAFWGTSQLTYDFTGRSLNQRFTDRFARWTDAGLPTEAARKNQALMQAEKARRAQQQQVPVQTAGQDGAAAAAAAQQARDEEEKRGALKQLWMGGEKDNWKEERLAKERQALDEGRSYWDLIMEQVSEVVNGKGSDGKKIEEASKQDTTDAKKST